MNKYIIEKDKYLNKYILWEKHRNYSVMIYSGYKYECESYKKWIISG